MLDKKICILNFDDSLTKQTTLLAKYPNTIVDLRDLGPSVRFWLNPGLRSIVEKRIKDSSRSAITLIGSGDFHHISEILISQFTEPLAVISFDCHPDWDTLPPRFGCGSWVTEVLKKKNILKLILMGISSKDISAFGIQTGNLNSLKDDRLEIYPYAHSPTRVFLKHVPKNVSMAIERGAFYNRIYWHELKNINQAVFLKEVFTRIPVKNVYISIDKDCLTGKYAITNWEEGKLCLEELLLMLSAIKENLNIVGLDICGDYSDISLKGPFKKIASYWDHPKDKKSTRISGEMTNDINEETNLKILGLFNP